MVGLVCYKSKNSSNSILCLSGRRNACACERVCSNLYNVLYHISYDLQLSVHTKSRTHFVKTCMSARFLNAIITDFNKQVIRYSP